MKNNLNIAMFQTDKPFIKNVYLNQRHIGILDQSKESYFLTLRNEKQLFKKDESFGISYNLLTDPEINFKWIVIIYKGKKFISTREYFLKKGIARQFNSFELQIFVPLQKLTINEVEKFEKEEKLNAISQQDLFSQQNLISGAA